MTAITIPTSIITKSMKARDDIQRVQTTAIQAFRQSQFEEAITATEEWMYLERKHGELESAAVAETLNFLGKVYCTMGDSDSAILYFKQAVEMMRKVQPDSKIMAKTLTNMGFIYKQHERNAQALRLLEESLSILEKVAPNTMTLANNYSNVAMILKDMDRVKESIRREKQGMEIKEKIAPGTESLAVTYLTLGQLYLSIGNPTKAIKYLQLAKKIAIPLDKNPLKMDVTMTLNEALSLQLKKGQTKKKKRAKKEPISLKEQVVAYKMVRPKLLNPEDRLISI